MAIRRVDPKATFKVICELDSAVIRENAEELAQLAADKKPTRHEDYLVDLDESKLKLDPNEKPNRFIVRCLKNDEYNEIQRKHMVLDVVNKTTTIRDNAAYFFELFEKACLGLEDENGVCQPVTYNEVGFGIAISIGASISLFTTLGRQLKNA